MNRPRAIRGVVLFATVALAIAPAIAADAPASQPADDAAALYLQAATLIAVYSPAQTTNTYTTWPPYPDKRWLADAKAAWDANGPLRDLARQARSKDTAVWPQDNTVLNKCRAVANDLGDAAEYADSQGNHAAAIDFVRDLLHMADMPQGPARNDYLHVLVGVGIRGLADERLMVIASDIPLTNDAADTRDLQVSVARDLIGQLLDQRDVNKQVNDIVGGVSSIARARQTLNRVSMETTFAAISLACHVYKYENGHWPDSLDQLVPMYLPRLPMDPFGNGKQPFGYVVIQGGLPDGSDRPMAYSRCQSRDGLFYRVDSAQYGFYIDGSNLPLSNTAQGGQFRDIARWTWDGHPPADLTPRLPPP
jgi:hypothetical protein